MSRETTADRAAIESRRVEKVYSVLSRVYDGSFDWALGPGRRRALERMEIAPGEQVLEVGVGTGLSLPLYPRDCSITGIDISAPMLEQARERAEAVGRSDVTLRLMDARELAFADGCFDHVLAPYVISVVPEPHRVMAEMCRVCRPGGSVVIVNHFLSERAPLKWFERVLTPASQWIGFRMDLPVSVVLDAPRFERVDMERVNLFGLWRLIVLRRRLEGN